MKMSQLASLILVALVVVTVPATAATIHVPDEQPTIQAGIDAASYGDTVLVACGVYYEHDITMKSGVYLKSETGQADCVTIDAERDGRVIYCADVDESTLIEGFTLIGGDGDYGGGFTGGGGMKCERSSPRIANCRFTNNMGLNGGAMFCIDGSNPTLTNCEFTANTSMGGGGGVHLSDSSGTFTDCLFSGNSVFGGGGGMSCSYSSPVLVRCTFSDNHNYLDPGAGLQCYGGSPTLTDCIIAFNTPGQAIYCSGGGASATLTCCDVYGNEGGDWVGCIAGQYGVNGNFSADPMFCMAANPDEPYSLQEDSPCRGMYSPCGQLVGAFGVGCPATSPVENRSWGSIKALYR